MKKYPPTKGARIRAALSTEEDNARALLTFNEDEEIVVEVSNEEEKEEEEELEEAYSATIKVWTTFPNRALTVLTIVEEIIQTVMLSVVLQTSIAHPIETVKIGNIFR